MKIKVCGMKEPQNIAQVVALNIDYLGFIFYEKSPRYIASPQFSGGAQEWGKTQKVGVFVNHEIEFILQKISQLDLNLVQLHGQETAEFCKVLQAMLPHNKEGAEGKKVEIIKVFSIGNEFDFSLLTPYKPFIDYFLFDTQGKNLGGNGITFNWAILAGYDNEVPFFLSGGIDNQHIEEIKKLNHLHIHALDINSKFEVSAGLKDVDKIKLFIDSLKNAGLLEV